jgi:hypothetical protein
MTHVGTAPVATPAVVAAPAAGFVEWSAVLAGAVLAAALSFVFLTFGSAIGLSATSPWPNSGLSAKVIASLAVFGTGAAVSSFMIGYHVAGRLHDGAKRPDEVEFRDGCLAAWSGHGVAIGAALLMATAGAVAGPVRRWQQSGHRQRRRRWTSFSTPCAPRSVAGAAPAPAGAAAAPRARPGTPATGDGLAPRWRILASVASGSMTEPNRTYLAQLIAAKPACPNRKPKARQRCVECRARGCRQGGAPRC